MSAETDIQPFTNFQWFLSAARNAVFFAGFTPERLSRADFDALMQDVLELAPQLNLRNDDRRQAHVDARPYALGDIAGHELVDDFDGLPDRALQPSNDLFEHPELPSFRALCFTLREGATAEGNRSLIVLRSSHALVEGVDTANVMRGRPSEHGGETKRAPRRFGRMVTSILAALALPVDYTLTTFNWRDKSERGVQTTAISRADVKRVAAEIGVQQRTLIFAAILYGFYYRGGRRLRRPHVLGYTNLSPRRFVGDDDFLQLRMQTATLTGGRDFADYARRLDARLARAGRDRLGIQMHYNAIFGIHRRIAKRLPFLYRKRFFSFAPFDFMLSMLPPHSAGGRFARYRTNNVYCGTYMTGTNACVIVPQPDRFTLNFYCPRRVLGRISDIEALFAEAGISVLAPGRFPEAGTAAASRARSPAEA